MFQFSADNSSCFLTRYLSCESVMRCRCVLVLGMPYPNPADPELRERMRFMDTVAATAADYQETTGGTAVSEPPSAGVRIPEAACLPADPSRGSAAATQPKCPASSAGSLSS